MGWDPLESKLNWELPEFYGRIIWRIAWRITGFLLLNYRDLRLLILFGGYILWCSWLLLSLCSGITPASARDPYALLEIPTEVTHLQNKCLKPVLSLWPRSSLLPQHGQAYPKKVLSSSYQASEAGRAGPWPVSMSTGCFSFFITDGSSRRVWKVPHSKGMFPCLRTQ